MKLELFQKTYHLLAGDVVPPPARSPSSGFTIPIKNPLTSVNSIPDLIEQILKILVQLGLPIVGIFVIYSGFLFVVARGNQSKIDEAKKTFFYTIIGAAIVLGAFVISAMLKATVTQLGG